jgi:hypothetical protein
MSRRRCGGDGRAPGRDTGRAHVGVRASPRIPTVVDDPVRRTAIASVDDSLRIRTEG